MTLTTIEKFLINFMADTVNNKVELILTRASLVQRSLLFLSIIGNQMGLEKLYIANLAKLINLDPSHSDLIQVFDFLFYFMLVYFGIMCILNLVRVSLIFFNAEKSLKIILQNIGTFHWNLLYLPMQNVFGFMLVVYQEQSDETAHIRNIMSDKVLYCSLAALAIVINLVFGFVLSYVNFSYDFKNKCSRRLSGLEISTCLIKSFPAIQVVFTLIINTNGRDWAVVFLGLLEGINLIIINKLNPFFHFNHTVWNLHISSLNFGLVLAYTIEEVIGYRFSTPIISGVLFYGLIYVALRRNVRIQQTEIFLPTESNMSETQIIRNLAFLGDILASNAENQIKNRINLIYCHGLISTHREKCKDRKCYCKYSQAEGEGYKIEEINHRYSDFVERFFICFCEEKILSIKNNAWLKIIYAQTLLRFRSSFYPKVLQVISSIPQSQRDFFNKIVISQINETISKSIKAESMSSQSKVDLNVYLKYKIDSTNLKKLIMEATVVTMDFWAQYKLEAPVLEKLFRIGKKFNSLDAKINSLWSKCNLNYYAYMTEETIIFAGYKSLIANNRIEGFKLKKNYENRFMATIMRPSNNIISSTSLSDPKNILLFLSMDRTKIGVINEITCSSNTMFGHMVEDLKGTKINILIPEYLQEKHDSYLINHLQTGTTKFFYKDKLVFGHHKEGYIMPLCLFICPLPNIDKGLSYISILKPLKAQDDYIIVSKDGLLLSWTENFQNEFSLTHKKDYRAKVTNYCLIFDEIIKFLDTYEWVLSNIAESEQDNFHIVKKLIDLEITRHPEKLSKFKLLENGEALTNLNYINKKLQGEGVKLDFTGGDSKMTSYLCSIDVSHAGHRDYRYFKLAKNVNNKFHTKIDEKFLKHCMSPKAEYSQKATKKVINSMFNESKRTDATSALFNTYVRPKLLEDSVMPNSDMERSAMQSSQQYEAAVTQMFEEDEDFKNMDSNSNDRDQEEEEEAVSNKMGDKKFFMKAIIGRMDDDTASQKSKREGSIGSVKSRGHGRPITEKTTKDKADVLNKWYGVIMLVFLAGVIAAMFNFYFYAKDILEQINMTITGIEAAANRQESFLMFYLAVRRIDSLHHGVLDPTYTGTEHDFMQSQVEAISKNIKIMDASIPKIKNVYTIMDPDDVLEISTPIHLSPPENPDNILTMSIDEGYSLMENIGLRIVENAMLVDVNFYLDQILAYGLNEFLIRSKEVINVFRDHLGERIDLIQGYLSILVISESIATIILIMSFVFISYENSSLRRNFLEALIKIEEVKYLPKIKNVENYMLMLQGISIEANKKKFRNQMRLAKKAKDGKKIQRRRRFKIGKLNRDSIFRIIQQTIIFLCIFMMIIIIMSQVYFYTDQISKYGKSYHTANFILEESVLVITAIDNYLQEPTGTLTEVPVKEQLWDLIGFLEKNQNFYLDLDIDHDDQLQIKSIAEVNYCFRYRKTTGSVEACESILGSSLRFGMSGMMNALTSSVKTILTAYDMSNKSEAALVSIYTKKVFYELKTLATIYIDPPFYEIRDYLQLRCNFYKNSNQDFVIKMNILYIVVVFILGFGTRLIYNKLIDEKKETFKLLSLIPPEIIMESPYVSKFL